MSTFILTKKNYRNFFCFLSLICILSTFSCAGNSADLQASNDSIAPAGATIQEDIPTQSSQLERSSYTFAIIVPQRDEFWEPIIKSAVAFAEKSGWQAIVCETEDGKDGSQGALILQLIRMGVDGIAIVPDPKEEIAWYIASAKSEDIPIVTIYLDVPLSDRIAFIGTDQMMAGRHMGKRILEKTGEIDTLIIVSADANDEVAAQRNAGINQIIGAEPGITVKTLITQENGNELSSETLYRYLLEYETAAVIALDDASAHQMIDSFKAHAWGNNEQHVLLCFDDTEANLAALKEGYVFKIIAQLETNWCTSALNMLALTCEGKSVPSELNTGTVVIHGGNIETYRVEAPYEE